MSRREVISRQFVERVHLEAARTTPVAIEVMRSATLDPPLAEIVSRRTNGIAVRFNDGYQNSSEYHLDREGARSLAAALTSAADVWDGLPDIEEQP